MAQINYESEHTNIRNFGRHPKNSTVYYITLLYYIIHWFWSEFKWPL